MLSDDNLHTGGACSFNDFMILVFSSSDKALM